jgi:predicted secreted protein
MNWFFGIVVYILIWWTLIFCILPYGNRSSEQVNIGEAPSAPQNPRIKQKFIITTIVTTIIWLLIYMGFELGWFSWDDLARSYNKNSLW